jgi:hypothetical protein
VILQRTIESFVEDYNIFPEHALPTFSVRFRPEKKTTADDGALFKTVAAFMVPKELD